MIDGFLNRIDDAGGNIEAVVLRCPVVVGDRSEVDSTRRRMKGEAVITVDGDSGLLERLQRRRQEPIGDVLMDEDGFGGIADADPLGLCVEQDTHAFVDVGVLVDVDMAVADTRFDDGNRRVLDDIADEGLAPTRNQDVDEAARSHQVSDRLMGLARHQDDAINWQAACLQSLAHDVHQAGIARRSRRRAAQERRIATLQAKTGGIDGDIGARFVDHAHHAHGHSHLTHLQAIGQRVTAHDFAHWVGQGGDIPQSLGDGCDARRSQSESIDDGRRGARGDRPVDIDAIGIDDALGMEVQGIGHGMEGSVLALTGEAAQNYRCLAPPARRIVDCPLVVDLDRSRHVDEPTRPSEGEHAASGDQPTCPIPRQPSTSVECLAIDHLDSDHLPGRQLSRDRVLIPQQHRHAQGRGDIAGFLPVPHLGAIDRVSTSEEEGMLGAQSLQGCFDDVGGNRRPGQGESDMPHGSDDGLIFEGGWTQRNGVGDLHVAPFRPLGEYHQVVAVDDLPFVRGPKFTGQFLRRSTEQPRQFL